MYHGGLASCWASAVSAKSYTNAGLPWFALYDEQMPEVPACPKLAAVKPVFELEAAGGKPVLEPSERDVFSAGTVDAGDWSDDAEPQELALPLTEEEELLIASTWADV
eukprot:SAG31_NODE_35412_length_323_cov_0.928571_1_plen_107_part_11